MIDEEKKHILRAEPTGTLLRNIEELYAAITNKPSKIVKAIEGSSALSDTLEPNRIFQLFEVRLHLDNFGGSGTFVVNVVSARGVEYNVNIISETMTTVKDLVFIPDSPMYFESCDKLTFNWENANGEVYGLEVIYSLL